MASTENPGAIETSFNILMAKKIRVRRKLAAAGGEETRPGARRSAARACGESRSYQWR